MPQSSEIPESWALTTVEAIADVNPPLSAPGSVNEDSVVNFVPMRAVGIEGKGLGNPETRRYCEVRKGYTSFLSGDVIMAKITPCMENGKTAVVPELPGHLCFGSTEFHVLRAHDGVDRRWLAAYLLRHDIRRAAQRAMTGAVGQMRVPVSFLHELTIPLAPAAEQTRIADALDELFSELDAAVAALERVREKLKLYRASVLKAAVEGSLTAAWRSEHPDVEPASELLKRILVERRRRWEEEQLLKYKEKSKQPPKNWKEKYKEPTSPDTTGLPELPEGWCWVSLDQLGRLDRGKSKHRPRDADFLYGGPYPFVQTGDIRKARQYLREHKQTYSEAGLLQSKLWPTGTLCVTIAANIAETAILTYPACFPDSVVGGSFPEGLVDVRYVEFFLRSARERIHSFAPATAQKNINNEILRSVALPLPPLLEQVEIVESLEGQMSIIEHLDHDLELKIQVSLHLRQSILRHAFSGMLVLQDPADEPASELLKRIAAERETKMREAAAKKKNGKNNGKHTKGSRRGRKSKAAGQVNA